MGARNRVRQERENANNGGDHDKRKGKSSSSTVSSRRPDKLTNKEMEAARLQKEADDVAAVLAEMKARKARREQQQGESTTRRSKDDSRRGRDDGRRERRRIEKSRVDSEQTNRRHREDSPRKPQRERSPKLPSANEQEDSADPSSTPFLEHLSHMTPKRIPRRYRNIITESEVSQLSATDLDQIDLKSIIQEASSVEKDDNNIDNDSTSADRQFIETIVQKVLSASKSLQEQAGTDPRNSKMRKSGSNRSNKVKDKEKDNNRDSSPRPKSKAHHLRSNSPSKT